MAKKIGSLLLCISSCYAIELELTVLNEQKRPVRQIEIDVPFFVRVSIKGTSSLSDEPEIEGLEQLEVQDNPSVGSKTMHLPSGIFKEVTVTYQAVAHTLGTLTLGPARLDGIQSDVLTLDVVQEPVQEVYKKPEVRFILHKKQAYKGEKVPFTYTFSWQDPEVSAPLFEPPSAEGVRILNLRKTRQYKKTHEGKDTYIVECKGDLYPLESGDITLGPFRVGYEVHTEDDDFFSYFPVHVERGGVQSKPVVLSVKPLPETDRVVQAVGTFNEFTAALSSSTVSQYEAVTLVLYLGGDADYTDMKVPTLELPEELRSYESKIGTSQAGISFVYVLQGLHEGVHKIPSQEFFYFDTSSSCYRTLKTVPLSLTVTPGAPQPIVPANATQEPEEKKEGPEVEVVPSSEWFVLPVWLFILLMLLPPVLVGCLWLYAILRPLSKKLVRMYRARTAFSRAQKQVALLTDYSQVYPLLKKALAEYHQLPQADEKTLIAALEKHQVSSELIEELKKLLYDANKVSVFSQDVGDASLFARAKKLLLQLSKVLVVLLVMPLEASSAVNSLTASLGSVPFIIWQLGVLIGWWTIWLCYKRLSSETRIVVIGLWCLVVTGWLLRSRVEYRPSLRVLTQAKVYVGPGSTYPVRATLEPAEELVLVKKSGPWYYVSSTHGIGWVHQEMVEKKRE